ncbi:MAG: YicC family protein [Phycisphaerae bacterium]|nr:YicC family protein [Phycisphaerae bacterium]
MTGFGVATAEADGARCTIELRSVNSRFFKCTLRLPVELQQLEPELEALLMRRLTRGSVTVAGRWVETTSRAVASINTAALQAYVERLRAALPAGMGNDLRVADLLSLPGVVNDDRATAIAERAHDMVLRLAGEACDALLAMREREGLALRETLVDFGNQIQERLDAVRARAPEVVAQYQERLRQRVNGLLKDVGATISEAELVKEVAIYAERSDVAEEIVRLSGHLEQYRSIIEPGNPQPGGRALDFLAQEMLREANTIASKSADVEISRRIVEIKTSIDRIKEQSQNAE